RRCCGPVRVSLDRSWRPPVKREGKRRRVYRPPSVVKRDKSAEEAFGTSAFLGRGGRFALVVDLLEIFFGVAAAATAKHFLAFGNLRDLRHADVEGDAFALLGCVPSIGGEDRITHRTGRQLRLLGDRHETPVNEF